MSKLDIDKTIDDLKGINKRLGFEYSGISDAIKVCKMWKDVKYTASQWDVGQAAKLSLHRIIEEVEEEFFPPLITQTVTIEIARKSESLLEDTVDQIRLVPGVKDVRPHDSRY